jgi:hypothetical protein
MVARELIQKYSMSQQVAARKLGTTQAAVSYYLYAKRGDKRMKQLESIQSIRQAASKVAKGIASEDFSMIDTMTVFCQLCVSLRKKDAICDLHRDFTALPNNCEACPDITQKQV